jgi:hypothetical protein
MEGGDNVNKWLGYVATDFGAFCRGVGLVCKGLVKGEAGIIKEGVSVIMGVVILGALVVALWPTFVGTDTDVQALVGTDAGTEFLQVVWPIVLIAVGIGLGAGVVFWVLRKFDLVD